MARRRRIYEGKAKVLFEGPEPGTIIQYFKDDATAFNAQKHDVITGKGVLNNRISEFIMLRLQEAGVPTHFIKRLNMREQLIKEYDGQLAQLRKELDLRMKVEVHEIEERKNQHINDLMKAHEDAFKEMKEYYNDITRENLELIRTHRVRLTEISEQIE